MPFWMSQVSVPSLLAAASGVVFKSAYDDQFWAGSVLYSKTSAMPSRYPGADTKQSCSGLQRVDVSRTVLSLKQRLRARPAPCCFKSG